jgi:hypothetical protein
MGVAWCEEGPATVDRSTPPNAADLGVHDGDTHWAPDAGPSSDTTVASTDPELTLNEVLPNPEGSDGDGFAEFIELNGRPGASMDGWTVALVDGRTGDTYATAPLIGPVPGDGIVVIGGTGVDAADLILPAALQQGPDGVALHDENGRMHDAVAWGGRVATLPGPSNERPAEGTSLVRCGDLWRASPPSPGRDDRTACAPAAPDDVGLADVETLDVSQMTPDVCDARATDLRLAEVFYDPVGADAFGHEFVELVGPIGTSLRGVRLVGEGDDGTRWLDQPLDGLQIGEDGYAVIGDPFDAVGDSMLDGTLQNGPDAITLIVCDVTVDEVHWQEDSEPGRSLSRCENDHWWTSDPTPRRANDGFRNGPCGPRCHPLIGHVLITEVLADVPGADRGFEFIELSGPAGVALDGAAVVGVNGSNGTPWFTQTLHGTIPAETRFVIAGAAVPERQLELGATLQNGPDSLVLVGCDSEPIDAIAWGHFGPFDTSAGEGNPAASPPAGQSLSRIAGDTNDNATDFAAATPSPGW